jgi:DnaJ family protein A protein 2
MEKEISLFEALCGFSFTIKHLDGRTLLVKSSSGHVIKPGDLKEIREEGMPTWKHPFDKGALIIKFNVKFPEYVNPQFKPVRASLFIIRIIIISINFWYLIILYFLKLQMLEQVLPSGGADPMDFVAGGADVEEVQMRDYRPEDHNGSGANGGSKRREAYETGSDDEGHFAGGAASGVSCAQQ